MSRAVTQGHPDHDACGTGFVTLLDPSPTHAVIQRALVALQRLSHRGGMDADGASGDGAGLLTSIPRELLQKWGQANGLLLPKNCAVGMVFVPAPADQGFARQEIEAIANQMKVGCLGWRPVPTNARVLGARASETLPSIWQFFLAPCNASTSFEHLLFLLRKRIEAHSRSGAYICSLSTKTIVYKGLLSPEQLPAFYPDLADPAFKSAFAIFHQRYSTNTQPAWSLAQPFRFLAHNGEINTVVGNRRWLCAREEELRKGLHADPSLQCLEAGMSDSASLDNAFELLLRQGKTPPQAMISLMPPFLRDEQRETPVQSYLESLALEREPWDGPAALVFSDGRMVGAKLDRNGLRPLRYTRSADGWLVLGSEVGIADFDDEIVERGRLGPGEILIMDTVLGKLMRNGEVLQDLASGHRSSRAYLQVGRESYSGSEKIEEPLRIAAAVGWSEDQYRFMLQSLAEGSEKIWSMGDDAAPAFLSSMRRPLWDYCKQRFAQVTNPPIDPSREAHVMSLATAFGTDLLLESPVLDEPSFSALTARSGECRTIDITFEARLGTEGATAALKHIADDVSGFRSWPKLILLSDRGVSAGRAALPALLATAAVWKAMVEAGGYKIPLVIETAQVIETHHLAMLIAVGANACFPYLAMQVAEDFRPGGTANFCAATNTGLRKVLSRIGISSLASYRNSHLFETIGLYPELCSEFFEDASNVGGGKTLRNVLQDYLDNHAAAYSVHSQPGQNPLKDAGLYRFRKDGERHSASPELMRRLHAHIKNPAEHSFAQVEQTGGTREAVALRDLMEFAPQAPVELSSVSPIEEILPLFSTQAMSLGAVSPEVHRTLAIAMNRLGAGSNTGEGGEDPELYYTDPESVCRTKQVASARFGVTTEYLVHAGEIEIKMAQGAKPGEGGQLPAAKVTPHIARLRHAVPGMALISPPPHHDIYSIEDLEQLIHDLREVNPSARIGVKLVSGAGVGIIAAGVAKAGADVITIAGHDGGTGASPLTSIKNTGLPWEFGLRAAHTTLVKCGLRDRVRLRVDGGLKLSRDIVIAAMLGADEFGFGTAALLAIGCVMARQCHLNTCPVGIATQDETLRARFTGKPEMVMAYFQSLAQAVRETMALVGAKSIADITGNTQLLRAKAGTDPISLGNILAPLKYESAAFKKHEYSPGPLQRQLSEAAESHTSRRMKGRFMIRSADRSVGANLSGKLVRKSRSRDRDRLPAKYEFTGQAGQSFGAFLTSGLQFTLHGEANDYVGKGLSGGTLAIEAGTQACERGDVLAGNTLLYGATAGELYISGRAGERFAVRNSGALGVVEGVGDHFCEYMTGGIVLNLGAAGMKVGSGMTGGLAYMREEFLSGNILNSEFVTVQICGAEEEEFLRRTLNRHLQLTGSQRAARLLLSETVPLVRIQPVHLPCAVEQTWAPILKRLPELGLAPAAMNLSAAEAPSFEEA